MHDCRSHGFLTEHSVSAEIRKNSITVSVKNDSKHKFSYLRVWSTYRHESRVCILCDGVDGGNKNGMRERRWGFDLCVANYF